MAADRPTLVIPGGSGFLGRYVAAHFVDAGWRVRILSRRSAPAGANIETVVWDGRTLTGDWPRAIDGATAVLNLAGRSVNCRYNAANRAEIERSRVASTRVLGEAIAACGRPPRVWLNSSTATIYRHAEDRPQDEFTGELGSGFSVNVARAWEAAFFDARVSGVRRVALRTAMVMGRGAGGPFDVFHRLVRFRLGGRMGDGRQRVSWIHVDDFVRAVRFLIDHDLLDGLPVNLVAPNVPTNAEFMATLRRASNVRIGLPATRAMLGLGAIVLRTETELPLKSRWVAPRRMLDAGFVFDFPDWEAATRDLVRQ